MFKTIEIENVQAGMVLRKSIHNRFGQMILPEGTKLEERHKRVLKTWGVKAVPIADGFESDDNEVSEVDEKIETSAKDYMNKKMHWTPRNEFEASMYQIALKRIIEKFLRQENDFS